MANARNRDRHSLLLSARKLIQAVFSLFSQSNSLQKFPCTFLAIFSFVSKALNNSSLIKTETKKKVLKTAKQMGYHPNFSARNLVSKKSNTIGVVWPTIERMAFSALIPEINKAIEKNGYSMLLSINKIHQYIGIFTHFQTDGIIVFEEEKDIDIDQKIQLDVPVLSYGVPKDTVVDANRKKVMHQAVEYLHGLGHTCISYLGDLSSNDPRQKEKVSGFTEAMEALNLPIEDNTINKYKRIRLV